MHEKGVDFTIHPIDLSKSEQYQRWFLEMNPKGEVPVLKHGQEVVVDSYNILKYIDQNFGKPQQFFPQNTALCEKVEGFCKRIDAIPVFPLTYGAVAFHQEKVTDLLRWPFNDVNLRQAYYNKMLEMPEMVQRKAVEFSDLEAGKLIAEKGVKIAAVWPIFHNVELYKVIFNQVEAVLDEVEAELESDNHLGPWLCGPTYTAADIVLSNLLIRLYQLGFDEKLWHGGIRPNVAVYSEMAFKRLSLEKATEWSQHKDKVFYFQSSNSQLNSAYFGVGAAIALGAVYAYKKFKK